MLSEGLSQEHSGTGFAAASGTLSSGLTGHGGTHTHRDGFKLPSDLSVVGPPTLVLMDALYTVNVCYDIHRAED